MCRRAVSSSSETPTTRISTLDVVLIAKGLSPVIPGRSLSCCPCRLSGEEMSFRRAGEDSRRAGEDSRRAGEDSRRARGRCLSGEEEGDAVCGAVSNRRGCGWREWDAGAEAVRALGREPGKDRSAGRPVARERRLTEANCGNAIGGGCPAASGRCGLRVARQSGRMASVRMGRQSSGDGREAKPLPAEAGGNM